MSSGYVFDQAWQGSTPGYDNLQVRRHDIRTDPLETGAFDLAHERVVLMYLRDPGQALACIIGALGRAVGWSPRPYTPVAACPRR